MGPSQLTVFLGVKRFYFQALGSNANHLSQVRTYLSTHNNLDLVKFACSVAVKDICYLTGATVRR